MDSGSVSQRQEWARKTRRRGQWPRGEVPWGGGGRGLGEVGERGHGEVGERSRAKGRQDKGAGANRGQGGGAKMLQRFLELGSARRGKDLLELVRNETRRKRRRNEMQKKIQATK